MITGQDVVSGYGQKPPKAHTSVLPYLRAQQAEKEKKRIEAEEKVKVTHKQEDNSREALKTSLKHIHPSATEAELEAMANDV